MTDKARELVSELASEEDLGEDDMADALIVLGSKGRSPAFFLLVDDYVGARAVCHLGRRSEDPLRSASVRFLTTVFEWEGDRQRIDRWFARCRETAGGRARTFKRIAAALERLPSATSREHVMTATGGWNRSRILAALLTELTQGSSGDDLIDTAADVASRHPELKGEWERIRSLLAFQATRNSLVHRLAGSPRAVLEVEELFASAGQAALAGEVISSIWQERMLEPSTAAAALGAKPSNREKVRQYRERSWLLGLPRDRGYLYPAFQFDLDRREVFSEVRRVNELLKAREDPWGVASWWFSRNDYLAERPVDLIGGSRFGEIVRAAETVLEPVG